MYFYANVHVENSIVVVLETPWAVHMSTSACFKGYCAGNVQCAHRTSGELTRRALSDIADVYFFFFFLMTFKSPKLLWANFLGVETTMLLLTHFLSYLLISVYPQIGQESNALTPHYGCSPVSWFLCTLCSVMQCLFCVYIFDWHYN